MEWTQKRTQKIGLFLIPVVLLFSCIFVLIDPPFMEILELKTVDFRFWIRGKNTPPGHVVVVAIDEKTVRAWGRWPPPRAQMAALVDHIAAQAPKVIVFDLLFTEKEHFVAMREPSVESLSPGDLAFQAAIKRAGNVVLPFALDVLAMDQKSSEFTETPSENILFSSYPRVNPSESSFHPLHAVAALAPLSPFANVAAAMGHVFILPDRDGVLRRETLVVEYNGDYYPPISLVAARLYLDIPEMEMALQMGEAVRLGKMDIPTDELGRITIDYFGKEKSYPFYSAVDVVSGQIPSDTFKGKIALIGASAMATADSKVTPFSNNMMGFEKNATVIENLITHRLFHRSEGRMQGISLGLIVLYGLILWVVMPRYHAVGCASWGGGLFVAHLVLATLLFIHYKIWIDVVYPEIAVVGSYLVYTGFQYFTEEKKARAIRKMFQSYVSPRVVEEMMKRPELARLGGYKQEVTILFADIVAFTPFCEERKERPTEVVSILNEYLGAMTDIVFRWEGTLDKFVGDSVMVFWGAPLPQEDHAWRAVCCARDMCRRLSLLQEKWRREGTPPLSIGIGINTGEVIVGNIGADGKKMDYTVIGDAVNLAARVESLTRQYESMIILTEKTYTAILPQITGETGLQIKKLGDVQVKGKEETISIYGLTVCR
jgi:adenylate cyclase